MILSGRFKHKRSGAGRLGRGWSGAGMLGGPAARHIVIETVVGLVLIRYQTIQPRSHERSCVQRNPTALGKRTESDYVQFS